MAKGVRLVRWLAIIASRLFYRIDVVGQVPDTGAVLLLPNHPNALLDPAIVWTTAGRDVRFLAKSTLFDGPWRPLLVGAGAIPVYRRMDTGADVSRNAEMFAAVAAALRNGDAVCLFPEGISHSTGRLEPLRTGAARMALDAERNGTRVALVAAGLNFDRKTTFRSRVSVVFGPPFSAHDLLPLAETDYSTAVRSLTERIADHMRRLLVEADPAADAALVDRVDRLYAAARGRPRDPGERVERRRAIATGMERLRTLHPDRYEAILMRLRRYDQRLRRFGIRDRHLDWQVSTRDALSFAVRELLIGLALLPLSVSGLLLFFIPYRLTGIVARRSWRETDVVATAQVVAGAIIYGAWLAIAAAIGWWNAGAAAAAATAATMLAIAVASLFALERESAVLDTVRSWLLLRRTGPATRERLRRYRSELADVLDEVHSLVSGNEFAV